MTGISRSANISTKQQKIATLAGYTPKMCLTSLSHHIDEQWLQEAFNRTRKSGSCGIDGQTAKAYEAGLQESLQQLVTRFKSGSYKAPPVKRSYIPKGDGTRRPIGIPTIEDKILQRAVVMALEPIYETDFYEGSYGFRPGRSAHQMLKAVRETLNDKGCGWVVEVDIRSFFDTLDHSQLRGFLDHRVRDGVIRRMIDKWLKAGVMEEGQWRVSKTGTPQGGVISPLLANIYLHYVLDEWFTGTVMNHLNRQAWLYRYADDFIICFQDEMDAQRVMEVLPKRFAKYGLQVHPDKTRLIAFGKPPSKNDDPPDGFDLLGFTYYWGKSRAGNWTIMLKTAKKRMNRGLKAINQWLKENRHVPIRFQHQMLVRKLKGHFAYYGVSFNSRSLSTFRDKTSILWWKWLSRRSQKARLSWEKFNLLRKRYALPIPKIMHMMYSIDRSKTIIRRAGCLNWARPDP